MDDMIKPTLDNGLVFSIRHLLPECSKFDYMAFYNHVGRDLNRQYIETLVEAQRSKSLKLTDEESRSLLFRHTDIASKINTMITAYVDTDLKNSDIYQWLVDQGITEYQVDFDADSFYDKLGPKVWIMFSNPSDAMLFKLTWVGV